MESNATTVALIHFKCHCFKMPSAGSASGHTLCKSAQLGWLQWDYSDLNQLQIHSFVLSLHPQQEGEEKRANTAEPRKFFADSHTSYYLREQFHCCSQQSEPHQNQSQAPCANFKRPLTEGFDDTAGKSPGWQRPLLVLVHWHSLIITSKILLEQPGPKWAFNQAPAPEAPTVPNSVRDNRELLMRAVLQQQKWH